MSTVFFNGEGRKIRNRRKALGLRQYQLAKKIGCSPQLISKIEKGELWNSKMRLALIKVLEELEGKNKQLALPGLTTGPSGTAKE